MAAPVVGVYARVAGVWERVNGGTPEGFSGPQVRPAGSWLNCVDVQAKASSVWQMCWVNIDGEINVSGLLSASDFDVGTPWSVAAGFRIEGDTGDILRDNNGSGYQAYSTWRNFDCGRNYEAWFEYDSGRVASNPPTLDTWIDLDNPHNDFIHADAEGGSGGHFSNSYYIFKVREVVSAPAAGNDEGTLHIHLEAEA